MKPLILIIALATMAVAQTRYTYHREYIVDSVIVVGDTTAIHQWVYSGGEQKGRGISCLVYHLDGNCSWNWFVGNRICASCLRKERVHEIVTTEAVKSEYEKLEEKLK